MTAADLAHLVGAWRSARCQGRCDECDPSFGCFAGPTVHARYPSAECRKPQANRCDGDSHAEQCPVELARQDLLAAHNALGAPGM